jgi:hypothetical protein
VSRWSENVQDNRWQFPLEPFRRARRVRIYRKIPPALLQAEAAAAGLVVFVIVTLIIYIKECFRIDGRKDIRIADRLCNNSSSKDPPSDNASGRRRSNCFHRGNRGSAEHCNGRRGNGRSSNVGSCTFINNRFIAISKWSGLRTSQSRGCSSSSAGRGHSDPVVSVGVGDNQRLWIWSTSCNSRPPLPNVCRFVVDFVVAGVLGAEQFGQGSDGRDYPGNRVRFRSSAWGLARSCGCLSNRHNLKAVLREFES